MKFSDRLMLDTQIAIGGKLLSHLVENIHSIAKEISEIGQEHTANSMVSLRRLIPDSLNLATYLWLFCLEVL
jgi:hypothetical protein